MVAEGFRTIPKGISVQYQDYFETDLFMSCHTIVGVFNPVV